MTFAECWEMAAGHHMVYLRPLQWLDIPKIRKMQIEAVMEAMIGERRFMYTDIFIRK